MENAHDHGKKDWYVLKVLSGSEKNIIAQIQANYEAAGLKDFFEEVYAPSIEVETGRKNGKGEKTKIVYLYPGYIFIKMVMTDKTKDAVMSVPRVDSFLSSTSGQRGPRIGALPGKISEREYKKMIEKISERHQTNVEGQTFAVGGLIRIKSGIFTELKGTILEVYPKKRALLLEVSVFQRPTRVTIQFDDAEKID
jgi:transcriptional antiterminator NusG